MYELIANLFIYLAGILWTIELIPQIKRTIEKKKVDDISLPFFIMMLLAYFSYMIGNTMLHNWNIVIAHIPSMLVTLVMLKLILKYR